MYDFSRIGSSDFSRLHLLLSQISVFGKLPFLVSDVADALDELRLKDLRELSVTDRQTLGDIYDECLIKGKMEIHGNTLRLRMLAYLKHNDSDGCYSDDDLLCADGNPMTLMQAAQMIVNLEA